jgi:hypothetical protein
MRPHATATATATWGRMAQQRALLPPTQPARGCRTLLQLLEWHPPAKLLEGELGQGRHRKAGDVAAMVPSVGVRLRMAHMPSLGRQLRPRVLSVMLWGG